MLIQILKYFGSIISEPIIRTTLNIMIWFQGFKSIAVGSWVFSGPTEFIQLIVEAKEYLQVNDISLLNTMTRKYTVIYSPKRIFSFPLWRYAGISHSFVEWGSEGVIAAWVYLYFNSLAIKKGRWFLCTPKNSLCAGQEANIKTREWLELHHFPLELCKSF